MHKYYLSALAICLAWAIISTNTCSFQRKSNAVIESNAKSLKDTLKQIRTKAGILVAVTKSQEGTIAELKVTNAAIINDRKVKTDLKDKQIEGAQDVNAQLQSKYVAAVDTTVRPNTHGDDTVETASACDSNSSLDIVITEDSLTGKRTLHAIDTTNIDLHLTEFTTQWNIRKPFKKPGPFASPEHNVSAYSNNKKAKITGLESVLVVKEKPRVMRTIEAAGLGVLAGLVIHSFIK